MAAAVFTGKRQHYNLRALVRWAESFDKGREPTKQNKRRTGIIHDRITIHGEVHVPYPGFVMRGSQWGEA